MSQLYIALDLKMKVAREAVCRNLWSDIPPVSPAARERIGYPTQKPHRATEPNYRSESSNPGDVVLDPFLRLRHGMRGCR